MHRKWLSTLPAITAALFLSLAAGQTQEKPKGDAKRGRTVFEHNCEECHDSESKEEVVGPGLKGLKDGKLPSGRPATHDVILDTIERGPAEMPSFKERLNAQEKEDLVAFLMTL